MPVSFEYRGSPRACHAMDQVWVGWPSSQFRPVPKSRTLSPFLRWEILGPRGGKRLLVGKTRSNDSEFAALKVGSLSTPPVSLTPDPLKRAQWVQVLESVSRCKAGDIDFGKGLCEFEEGDTSGAHAIVDTELGSRGCQCWNVKRVKERKKRPSSMADDALSTYLDKPKVRYIHAPVRLSSSMQVMLYHMDSAGKDAVEEKGSDWE
ncbi:hypothetical protein BJ138DRAFT_1099579 [Hygrophoropsis aurantiaca]|uniref:Uncharacterized protein n=1 Tax=Hygrophoropsis aurantiaca TaxID=72124 RepID=A0ACB8AJH8_9AGAM|nr:hypothetical protein BJ138DRAFT_1099579 [Hygrophoropsis aurantiaca]